jgi:hypothetical protein
MEACITNLLEPGETIVVGNAGIWGQRVLDMSSRFGAKAVDLKAETGRTLTKDQIAKALREHRPAVLFLCQGESSTGVHQSLAGLGDLCRETGTLLLVDTVCSLGGVPMYADAWGVDAIYSGTQKVLSGPPGGAPLFFGPRAMEKLAGRKTKPISYTWDMNLVGDYWGWNGTRSYHHTGCVSTWYAMREALALVSLLFFLVLKGFFPLRFSKHFSLFFLSSFFSLVPLTSPPSFFCGPRSPKLDTPLESPRNRSASRGSTTCGASTAASTRSSGRASERWASSRSSRTRRSASRQSTRSPCPKGSTGRP